MITRLDHAVIGVADLDRAIDAYRRLGFVVRPGGRHTGEGTHNAIVRFGLDYLELMAVHDEARARTRPLGSELLQFLRRRDGGLIGFVVAGLDSDDLAAAMRHAGFEPVGPIAMQRERADGRVLSWRLLFPHGPGWRDIAPFVVEWVTSDVERLAWDAPVPHPNAVTRIAGLRIVVPDVAAARTLYSRGLGLAVAPLGAAAARVTL
ncbi:MAG: VOC family protein, partial [Chloroflexota bacterium]|nr:VOC family protein [Chloroflexota bacterium]